MSLNKSQDYDKYSGIKFQYKAKKLGLIDSNDNECCFIKDDGSKEIISRRIVAGDLPQISPIVGGTQTFMHKLVSNIIQIDTINTPVEIIPDANLIGSKSGINTSAFERGDFFEYKCSGHYGTRLNTNEFLRGVSVILSDGVAYNQTLQLWDGTGIEALVFPHNINSTGFWDLSLRVTKTETLDVTSNGLVSVKIRAWSPTNTVLGCSSFQVEQYINFVQFDTDNFSCDIKFKPGSSSGDVSPNFVIYNTETTGTITSGIGKVQSE